MKTECMRLKLALWNEDIFKSRPSFTKWVLKKKKKSRFFTVNVQKQLFLFKKLRQYTPLSIIFSIFSQQFLFPFFLNIASDIWLYWLLYQCLSIRNAKWSLPKWNFQWMAREKKMKSYFPCWWCLFCKSQTTVFHLCVHFSSQEDKKMEEQYNGVSSYFSQCMKIKNHKNSLMHAGLFLNGSLFKCPVFENDKILSLWRDTL